VSARVGQQRVEHARADERHRVERCERVEQLVVLRSRGTIITVAIRDDVLGDAIGETDASLQRGERGLVDELEDAARFRAPSATRPESPLPSVNDACSSSVTPVSATQPTTARPTQMIVERMAAPKCNHEAAR